MSWQAGYQLREAQESITLSRIAYTGEDDLDRNTITAAITRELAQDKTLGSNFHLVWLGISPDFSTLSYVARDGRAPCRFAMAVRGTDVAFPTDWRDDLMVLTTHAWPSAQPPDPAIAVASGSWDGLQDLLAMSSPALGALDFPVNTPVRLIDVLMSEALSSPPEQDLDLLVTGHSLGGALASLLALWLADTCATWHLRPRKVNLKSYTFASPTVGNQAFADYYAAQSDNQRIGWQAYRVYNEQDVVPCFFGDLSGVEGNGIPVTAGVGLEIATAMAALIATLAYWNVHYVQVGDTDSGTAHPLRNQPPLHPPRCASPAATLTEYAGCWVGYEHATSTYLDLLGVAPPAIVGPRPLDRAGGLILLAAATATTESALQRIHPAPR